MKTLVLDHESAAQQLAAHNARTEFDLQVDKFLSKKFDLTLSELKEYNKLNEKVHGKGIAKSLFTVMDSNNPDHVRLNELSGKVIKMNAWMVSNRQTI